MHFSIRTIGLAMITTLLAGACSMAPEVPSNLGETANAENMTVINVPARFQRELIDESGACRLWARNRDGENMRPCAGEAPTCGAPIEYGEVNVIQGGAASDAAQLAGGATLVTPGFYRFLVTTTVQEASQELTRRVAREGCDTLVLGGTEWITLRSPESRVDYPYLRAQWGSSTTTATAASQSAE